MSHTMRTAAMSLELSLLLGCRSHQHLQSRQRREQRAAAAGFVIVGI
jgi:hypothetical protein